MSLFQIIDNATIKNLTLQAFNITGKDFIGLLAGEVAESTTATTIISNVNVLNSSLQGVTSTGILFGRTRQNLIIENVNIINSSLVASGANAGGIIGKIESNVNAVTFTGVVVDELSEIAGASNVGGLVGANEGQLMSLILIYNYAHIQSSGSVVGGMIGLSSNILEISKVANYGTVDGAAYGGGIIGRINGGFSRIDQAGNFGDISTTNADIGGLIGGLEATNPKLIVTNSLNIGRVEITGGSNNAGGIFGYVRESQTAEVTLSAIYSAGDIVVGSGRRSGLIFGRFDNAITQLFTGNSILISWNDLTVKIDGFMTTSNNTYDSASTKTLINDMKKEVTYTTWDISNDGSKIWRINEGVTLPWLSFMGETPPTQVVNP
jgi:hypothetical protein